MERYHKKCWYCGGKNMEAKEGYWQCRDCGATYDEPKIVGPAEIEPCLFTHPLVKGEVSLHGYQLTSYAKRMAAKAREMK